MELAINAPAVGAEKLPDYSEGIMLNAFNEAYDNETCISNPDGFKEALESIVVHELVERQTPQEYEEFDSQLKAEIINFFELYTGEPWDAPNGEPGIAEYIKPALALVTGKEEFVASEAFTDVVVQCAFKTAPFSMQKVTDMLALTDVDLSEKIHNQISVALNDPKGHLPHLALSYQRGFEKSSMFVAFHNLNELYPDAELDKRCLDNAKAHLREWFLDYLDNADGEGIIPEWDEAKILGFDLDEMRRNQEKGLPCPLQFSGEYEIADFVDKRIEKYAPESSELTYETFTETEAKLVNFAKSMGLEDELRTMFENEVKSPFAYIGEKFKEMYKEEIIDLIHHLIYVTGAIDDRTQDHLASYYKDCDDTDAIKRIRKQVQALYEPPTVHKKDEWC